MLIDSVLSCVLLFPTPEYLWSKRKKHRVATPKFLNI